VGLSYISIIQFGRVSVMRTVKIHGDDMVGASTCEQVRNQRARLRNPLPIADLRLKSRGLGGVRRLSRQAIDAVGSMVTVEVGRLVRPVALARVHRLRTPNPILNRTSRAGGMAAITLVQLHSTELVVQCRRAIRQACALGLIWMWCLRARVEGVGAGSRATGYLRQRCARLVVGDVGLARVGEEREDGRDALRRGGAAGGDGDEKSKYGQALHSTTP
jgi:hypothetical protein